MYEPSRHYETFHIAGFQYYDGALVLNELKVGSTLDIVPEFDNPHDPNAIALYFNNMKLGHIPRYINEPIAQMAYFGHTGAFECRVLQIDMTADPWEQVRVGLFFADKRQR